ncbi:hypothetical protein AAG906_020455 [Vitis piasezkii]
MRKNEEFFITFVRRRRTHSHWSFEGFEGRRQLKVEQLECRLPGMLLNVPVKLPLNQVSDTSRFQGSLWGKMEKDQKLLLLLSSTNGLVDAQLDLDSTISDSEIQNVVVTIIKPYEIKASHDEPYSLNNVIDNFVVQTTHEKEGEAFQLNHFLHDGPTCYHFEAQNIIAEKEQKVQVSQVFEIEPDKLRIRNFNKKFTKLQGIITQPTVSCSSIEVKYRALASPTAEVTWIAYLLHDLSILYLVHLNYFVTILSLPQETFLNFQFKLGIHPFPFPLPNMRGLDRIIDLTKSSKMEIDATNQVKS